jgi:hypothetical protein
MSFILVFAISSSWARVILPTLSLRAGRTLVELDGFLDQNSRRRRLDNEGEALVCKGRDHHRQWQSGLDTLGLRIERLAEFHDVQATLTQRRANRGVMDWPYQLALAA